MTKRQIRTIVVAFVVIGILFAITCLDNSMYESNVDSAQTYTEACVDKVQESAEDLMDTCVDVSVEIAELQEKYNLSDEELEYVLYYTYFN